MKKLDEAEAEATNDHIRSRIESFLRVGSVNRIKARLTAKGADRWSVVASIYRHIDSTGAVHGGVIKKAMYELRLAASGSVLVVIDDRDYGTDDDAQIDKIVRALSWSEGQNG
jgi:hypothetical protein